MSLKGVRRREALLTEELANHCLPAEQVGESGLWHLCDCHMIRGQNMQFNGRDVPIKDILAGEICVPCDKAMTRQLLPLVQLGYLRHLVAAYQELPENQTMATIKGQWEPYQVWGTMVNQHWKGLRETEGALSFNWERAETAEALWQLLDRFDQRELVASLTEGLVIDSQDWRQWSLDNKMCSKRGTDMLSGTVGSRQTSQARNKLAKQTQLSRSNRNVKGRAEAWNMGYDAYVNWMEASFEWLNADKEFVLIDLTYGKSDGELNSNQRRLYWAYVACAKHRLRHRDGQLVVIPARLAQLHAGMWKLQWGGRDDRCAWVPIGEADVSSVLSVTAGLRKDGSLEKAFEYARLACS